MFLLEVTDKTGFAFPVFADDEDLTDLQRLALEDDGAPSPEEAVAAQVVDFFGPDASARVLDSDFDQHGITGSTPEGNALPEGTFGAQIMTETWEAFESWGGANGYLFYVRSLDKERIVQAGVDAGYNEVVEQIRAAAESAEIEAIAALDEDDFARIANALRLAWSTGLYKANKVQDQDMRSVMQGMAGSYSQTLEKVEAILNATD